MGGNGLPGGYYTVDRKLIAAANKNRANIITAEFFYLITQGAAVVHHVVNVDIL